MINNTKYKIDYFDNSDNIFKITGGEIPIINIFNNTDTYIF